MKKYKASLNRNYGELSADVGRIVFNNSEKNEEISISFSDLVVDIIKDNNEQVLLKSKSKDITISTYELGIVNDLEKLGYREANSLKLKIKRTKRNKYIFAFLIVLTPIVFILIFPLILRSIPFNFYTNYIPIKSLKFVGQSVLSEIKIYPASISEKVESIAENIIEKNPELQEIPFEFYISNSEEVNAYALPGGIVVFNRGLIEKLDSIGELYGVMAHEMAHIHQRHILKSLLSKMGPLIGVILLESMFSGSSKVTFNLTNFLDLAYSRESEKEADYIAINYLDSADISGDGLELFLNKIATYGSTFENILSTHPSSQKRIDEIKLHKAKLKSHDTQWNESVLIELKSLIKDNNSEIISK